jgi:hypothetical protein
MNKPDSRKALGKGIDALMRARPTTLQPQSPVASAEATPAETSLYIAIDLIDREPASAAPGLRNRPPGGTCPIYPRQRVIQPLVVRKVGDRYQLVAGSGGGGIEDRRIAQVPCSQGYTDDRLSKSP